MTKELAWSLGATVPYTVGETLSTSVRITAPEAGIYYVVGALYSLELTMYIGTLFGLLQEPDTLIADNDPFTLSIFSLEEEEELGLTTEFLLNRTGCVLAIFLYRMERDMPDLGEDVMVYSVSVSLVSPGQQAVEERSTILNALMGAVVVAMMIPIIAKIGRQT